MGAECNCLKDDKENEFRIGADIYSFKKMVCKKLISIKIINIIYYRFYQEHQVKKYFMGKIVHMIKKLEIK